MTVPKMHRKTNSHTPRPIPSRLTSRVSLCPLHPAPIGASLPRLLDHIVDPLLLERLVEARLVFIKQLFAFLQRLG